MRLAFALPFFLVACGGPETLDDVPPLDASFDTTTTSDGSTFDASFQDVAPPDAAKITLDGGGGPFLCHGCICDGTLDLCFTGGGGPSPAPFDDAGFGDAAACDPDASVGCNGIPIDCLPDPSCDCILAHYPKGPCTCDVDPSGNGFRVDCNFP